MFYRYAGPAEFRLDVWLGMAGWLSSRTIVAQLEAATQQPLHQAFISSAHNPGIEMQMHPLIVTCSSCLFKALLSH